MAPDVANALVDFEGQFRWQLLQLPNLIPETYRQDVTAHVLWTTEWPNPPEPTLHDVRGWLEPRGVMCIVRPNEFPGGAPWWYLAPIIPIPLIKAYHATTRRRWHLIQLLGLLPGNASAGRFTSANRFDCEGNIYVCEKLGTPADAGVRRTNSAYWWRDHKARNNVENDPDWVILEVDLSNLPGLLAYTDLYSDSGIIIRGIDCIHPDRITLIND